MVHSYSLPRSASSQLNFVGASTRAAVQFLAILLAFVLWLLPTPAAAASPHIYDVPNAGPPGSQVTTLGTGFDGNATIDIYFDTTHVDVVVTDKSGSFGMALRAPTIRQGGLAIQVPKDAVPGTHWITGVERITQLQAQVAFNVWADWPQFHLGPDRTGFNPYENVLSPQTVGDLAVSWTYAVGGLVFTSPTVANGVLYVGSVDWDNTLHALDASTGASLWSYPASPSVNEAAAVFKGVVYVSSCSGDHDALYALKASSGTLLWSYPLSCGSSPAVVDGMVYISSKANVHAVNASTGEQLWNIGIADGLSSPAVANGIAYVGSMDGNLYAMDAHTGALLWKFAVTPGKEIWAAPAVVNGMVYVTSSDDNIYALNASTGALIWKYATKGALAGSPAVANGVVYFGSCYPDDTVYALNASTGALVWKYGEGADVMSSPAVANGVVYFFSDRLYALNAATGEPLWQTTAVSSSASPAVVNGMVYLGSDDGNLYAFGLHNQQRSDRFRLPERPDPALLLPNGSLPPKK